MGYASVGSVQIGGPFRHTGAATGTASRQAIFVCAPATPQNRSRTGENDDRACATRILSRMARLAYRRPVTKEDVQTLLGFFDSGRRDGEGFDAGIQFALERLLVDPDFLLRVYRDPSEKRRSADAASPAAYRISDIELASRLSFFLWSSIPDERLIDLAERGQLSKPSVLDQQVRRMLADPRATRALVDDFTAPVVESAPPQRGVGPSGSLSQLR